MRLHPDLALALGMIEAARADDPEATSLHWEVAKRYGVDPVSDAVARANLAFLLTVRRDESKVKLFESARLNRQEALTKDLADFYLGESDWEPLSGDQLGAIDHWLDLGDPNKVVPTIECVNDKLHRADTSD